MKRLVLKSVAFIILVAVAVLGIASANVHVEHRGIVYYHGLQEPDITCDNNTKSNASVYFRGKMYVCPFYSTTEIVN